MRSSDLETAIHEFRNKQRKTSFTLFLVVIILLAATISTFGYLRYQSRQAEARAEAQKEQLEQLAAEAHMRWDMRTDRPLDRAEILQRVTGDLRKKVIQTAIDRYEQRPPIPYTWGGKSPKR